MTRVIALTATLAVMAVGLGACGGSSGTTTATATTIAAAKTSAGATSAGSESARAKTPGSPGAGANEATAAARAAAVGACLAKKGVTLPQRQPGGGLGGAHLPQGMSRAQFAQALHTCAAAGRPGGRAEGAHSLFEYHRVRAGLVRYVACLREHGVDLGEPNTTGNGPIFGSKGIRASSEQLRAALAKCRGAAGH